jgi:hypothetical protein
MGHEKPRNDDVLLAIALGARRQVERRILPDRRSGIERRKRVAEVAHERRSGGERRQLVRRDADHDEGPTLLAKARTRMVRRLLRHGSQKARGDGLR